MIDFDPRKGVCVDRATAFRVLTLFMLDSALRSPVRVLVDLDRDGGYGNAYGICLTTGAKLYYSGTELGGEPMYLITGYEGNGYDVKRALLEWHSGETH